MTADRRVEAAREYLTGARKRRVTELPPSLLVRECAELRRIAGQLLDVIGEQNVTPLAVNRGGKSSPPGGEFLPPESTAEPTNNIEDPAGRLARIRQVLAEFDWEFHDRQLALERIERIANGGPA